MVKTRQESAVVYGTEDLLTSLCNSVTHVLSVATQCKIHYSGMVQRITKTCLKPDIGCFVLFDGGFSGLVVLNFTAATGMELYESYMLHMGMPKSERAMSHPSDEVSDTIGEMTAGIRSHSNLPIAVGFGISNVEQAREVARHAEAIVVGSAIVNRIATLGRSPDLVPEVSAFVASLSQAIQS